MQYHIYILALVVFLSGCATIVNDPMVPVTPMFADGTTGACTFHNKRGSWTLRVPGTTRVRRSDDALIYTCTTRDGREVTGAIPSLVEGDEFFSGMLFLDIGLIDVITDKHRRYPSSVVLVPMTEDEVEQITMPYQPAEEKGILESR